jgi:putative ABC transport system substrate-binding protein
MHRRMFIGSVAAGLLAVPLAALAQQSDRVRRIGVLMSVNETDPEGQTQFSGFRQRLAELGWTDARNLRMEVRWGGSNVNQIGLFAKELVGLKPDLIVAQGTPVTAALQRETRTIPIVFVVVTDPVGEGFVAALSPATAARAKPRRRASVLTERFGVM